MFFNCCLEVRINIYMDDEHLAYVCPLHSAIDRYYEAMYSLPKLESGSFEHYLQDTVQTCLNSGEKAKDEVRVHHWRLIYFREEQKG